MASVIVCPRCQEKIHKSNLGTRGKLGARLSSAKVKLSVKYSHRAHRRSEGRNREELLDVSSSRQRSRWARENGCHTLYISQLTYVITH